MTRELMRRSVREKPSDAAAAFAAVTPGTTSKGIFAARRASSSSLRRPKTPGSPLFRRTTCFPSRAASTISALISNWVTLFTPQRLPTLTMIERGPAREMTAALTRSSRRTRSASLSRRRALIVRSSGSPGPAPTRKTFPVLRGLGAIIGRSPKCLRRRLRVRGALACEFRIRDRTREFHDGFFRRRRANHQEWLREHLRTRDEVFARRPGFRLRWKSQFANLRDEPRQENRNRSSGDRPRRCKGSRRVWPE